MTERRALLYALADVTRTIWWAVGFWVGILLAFNLVEVFYPRLEAELSCSIALVFGLGGYLFGLGSYRFGSEVGEDMQAPKDEEERSYYKEKATAYEEKATALEHEVAHLRQQLSAHEGHDVE